MFLLSYLDNLTTNPSSTRPNGVRFVAAAGTSEFAKKTLMEGDIVSFKHRGYLAASKKPKFPSLYRVRLDLTWEDVSNNWETKLTSSSSIVLSSPIFFFAF